MTEEDQLLLISLKKNAKQLFQKIEFLESEKTILEEKLNAYGNEIESLKQKSSELSLKNEQLKMATHLLSGVDEKGEARQRINKLIREIDKCIALLNR
jgi:predicted nuclease with TOPRIM domain